MTYLEAEVHEVRPATPEMCDSCEIRNQFPDTFKQEQFQTGVVYLRTSHPDKQSEYLEGTKGTEQFSKDYRTGMFTPTEAEVIIGCMRNEACRDFHRGFSRVTLG